MEAKVLIEKPHNMTLEQAKMYIQSVNLTPVIDRLVYIEHWTEKEATEAIKQYRNYLFLRKKYSRYNLPPSKDIDEVWHAHVLHTKEYRQFCKQVFYNEEDQFLDHHPHIAKEGTMEKLNSLFEKTQDLYHKEFGEYIYLIVGRSFIQKVLDKIRDLLLMVFPKLADVLEK